MAVFHEELLESELPELKVHAATIVNFLTRVAEMGGDPNQQMLLVDYDRTTKLPLGTEIQAVPVLPETTNYARDLLNGRYVRRE